MNSNSKKEMIPPVVNPDTTFVGLDISKGRLDSFVPGGQPREDANTPEGQPPSSNTSARSIARASFAKPPEVMKKPLRRPC